PQNILLEADIKSPRLFTASIRSRGYNSCFFILLQQGKLRWWQAIEGQPEQNPTVERGTDDAEGRATGTTPDQARPVLFSDFFNDRITNIFREQYLSPRPAVPTLQLPVQGIGNWCYPLTT